MKLTHRSLFVIALVAAVGMSGCDNNTADKAQTPQGKDTKAASPVLAVVNGRNITIEEFEHNATSLQPMAQMALAADDKNKNTFLDSLIDRSLIVQKAESLGLDKDPEFQRKLDRQKSDLLLQTFIKKEVVDKSVATDAELKTYFDAHKDELGSVRLSHIIVGSQEEAVVLLSRLKGGEDFAKVAKSMSMDPKTKNSGGDLGYVKWQDFGSPNLKTEAFKLKKGETSGIIQSQYGLHVLKVTDKKPAADADFAVIKEQLKATIEQKKKEDLLDSAIKEMKAKAKFQKFTSNLKQIKIEPPTQAMQGMPGQPGRPARPAGMTAK